MGQDEVNDEMAYRTHEFGKVKGDRIRLKVESSDGDTRWLSITRKDLDAVVAALLNFDPDEWEADHG
jgi:hypothetical protein